MQDARELKRELEKRGGRMAVQAFYKGLAKLFSATPVAWPKLYDVEVVADVPYKPGGNPAHLLDIYRPKVGSPDRPAVMYIHGGAFHFMSRKTHWLMGLLFASQGYVVYNVEYRLAPRYRFPAAVQDVLDAYAWIVTHRSAHGAAGPIVVAGESAGANLSWSVLLASCYERSEEWARRIFDLGVVPRACVSLCGMLQVTDPERYLKDSVPRLFYDRIQEVAELYLPEGGLSASDPVRDFADPLLVLERGEQPRRPLPPVVGTVGTADPLIEDTRRLDEVLDRFGVPHRFGYYPGQIHAFQAFIWSRPARKSWQEVFTFLGDVAGIHARPTGSAWAKRLVVEG